VGLLDTITRDDILRCQAAAGFSPLLRPSAEMLHWFLVEAGSAVDEPRIDEAQQLLDEFVEDHVRVSNEIERAIVDGGLTAEERRDRNGPYLPLADLLARFLVRWGEVSPFGEDSLLAALVYCEQILAWHNFVVSLAYPDDQLKGAVIRWHRVLMGEVDSDVTDPLGNLRNAILGRFRGQV
jgi:hypothetical protein